MIFIQNQVNYWYQKSNCFLEQSPDNLFSAIFRLTQKNIFFK